MSLTDKEVAFLRGLIAGEGHFGINLRDDENYKFNVGSRLIFKMEMAEQSDILQLLHSKTGLGNVYKRETRESLSDVEEWKISKRSELDELQTILRRGVTNRREFLLALMAGEGSFGINLSNDENYKFNVDSQPAFQMKMAEQSGILPTLQSKTGLGNVYKRETRESSSDTELWKTTKQAELDDLAHMIEEQDDSLFWETDKGETFKKWEEARELKEEIGTSDPEAVKEIIDTAKSLNGTDRGRPAEEWKAIVDEAVEERQ